MAYQIRYGPEKHRVKAKNRGRLLIVLTFLMSLLTGIVYREQIRNILLPPELEFTVSALHNAVENLQGGDRFADVFSCFCQEIADGAQQPQ